MTNDPDSNSTNDRTTKHTDGGRQVAVAGTSATNAIGRRTRVVNAIALRLAAAFDAYAYRWVQASFAFVRDYAEMWSDRDAARIPDLVSESFVMYDEIIPDGEVHGRDGLNEWISGRSHV